MKLNKHLWAMVAVALILFHVLAFAIPFSHTAVFWIAYGVTLFIFAMLSYTTVRVMKHDRPSESIFLGWPLLRVSRIITAIQMIVFFVLAALAGICSVPTAIVIEAVVFAVAYICLMMKNTTKSMVRVIQNKPEENTVNIRRLRAQAKALYESNNDPALKPVLKALFESLRYADPVSNSSTLEIETLISEKLATVSTLEEAKEIQCLIHTRTELCMTGKR